MRRLRQQLLRIRNWLVPRCEKHPEEQKRFCPLCFDDLVEKAEEYERSQKVEIIADGIALERSRREVSEGNR